MKDRVDLVVVIPVGPRCNLSFVEDTIDSVYDFVYCKYKIIVLDDSMEGAGQKLKDAFPDIDLITNARSHGRWGGLYINLCKGYRHAVEHYHFDALLKLDTDALIIGSNPQEEAIRLFKENPNIGIAGLHYTEQSNTDFYGNKIDNSWPRKQLIKDTCTWKLIRRPLPNLTLRKYFFRAIRKGYQIGENIFGGSYFMSESLLMRMKEEGLLPQHNLKGVNLEEDHIFGILARSLGYELGDLASGDLPFGVAWLGLPAPPEELLKHDKKIIHSTRKWGEMDEKDIRSFFKKQRQTQTGVMRFRMPQELQAVDR
ncbi:MAG TPA: hypothetical protein VGK59_12665 [Ohtaekwangia sp.]